MEARPLVSPMKVVFFLAAISAPLLALAEPGDLALAQAVRRQPGSRFYARSGVDPSTVTPECQSVCTPIITTLDVSTCLTYITGASFFIITDVGTVELQRRCFVRMHTIELRFSWGLRKLPPNSRP